jgi:hypothetical protein
MNNLRFMPLAKERQKIRQLFAGDLPHSSGHRPPEHAKRNRAPPDQPFPAVSRHMFLKHLSRRLHFGHNAKPGLIKKFTQ